VAAREAYAKQGFTVDYRNVKQSDSDLQEMLKLSKGAREVPVILRDGKVSIGWEGKT